MLSGTSLFNSRMVLRTLGISADGGVDVRMRNSSAWALGWTWTAGRKKVGGITSRRDSYFESFTMPTISIGAAWLGFVKCRPMAITPGKNLRAADSFTMATGAEVFVSRSSKSRPARIGVRNVRKYSGETKLKVPVAWEEMPSRPGETGSNQLSSPIGVVNARATDVTPGSAR